MRFRKILSIIFFIVPAFVVALDMPKTTTKSKVTSIYVYPYVSDQYEGSIEQGTEVNICGRSLSLEQGKNGKYYWYAIDYYIELTGVDETVNTIGWIFGEDLNLNDSLLNPVEYYLDPEEQKAYLKYNYLDKIYVYPLYTQQYNENYSFAWTFLSSDNVYNNIFFITPGYFLFDTKTGKNIGFVFDDCDTYPPDDEKAVKKIIENISKQSIIHKYVEDRRSKKIGIVINSRLRVRENNSLDTNIVGLLEINEKVYILDKSPQKQTIDGVSDCWYKIDNGRSLRGWAFGGFLKIMEEN